MKPPGKPGIAIYFSTSKNQKKKASGYDDFDRHCQREKGRGFGRSLRHGPGAPGRGSKKTGSPQRYSFSSRPLRALELHKAQLEKLDLAIHDAKHK